MNQITPQQFAQLQREVAALRAQVGRRRRLGRARAVVLGLALVALLALSPLAALAANFTDLNPGSPHNANINAIADAGISLGCNPAGTQYCPNQLVTREQMASFLARTAGLGTNPPIANAATAQTAVNATNAQNAVTAQTATNAAQLGGVPASGYLQSSGTLVYSFAPIAARSDDPLVTFSVVSNGGMNIGTTSAPAARVVYLPLDLPRILFGVPLKFASVEVCSFTGGGTQPSITSTSVQSVADFAINQLVIDSTTHPEGECYTLTPPAPVAFTGGVLLKLTLSFPNTSASFSFTRTTVTLTP